MAENLEVDRSRVEDQVAQALVGATEPDQLDSYRFAAGILPVFDLVKSLFSQNPVDTCLKLMLLFELTRTPGRFGIDMIRSRAAFLDPGRVDALVRSLRDGGWFDVRASDSTYVISPLGVQLLGLLHGADFGGLSPANVLARAAQNAAFAAGLDGAEGGIAYLLDQLMTLLDNQVEDARAALQRGRPFALIAWARNRHAHQNETIRHVLGELEKRLDAASADFGRIVELHGAMQRIVEMHRGIHERLRDWNLERLFTARAGYSIPELVEAVMALERGTSALDRVLDEGIVSIHELPPAVTTKDVRDRFQGVRRRQSLRPGDHRYSPPPPPTVQPWSAAEADPAVEMREHFTRVLAGRTPEDSPLEMEDWFPAGRFSTQAYRLALLARLHTNGITVRLADGRTALLRVHSDPARDLPPGEVLDRLEALGVMRTLASGHRFSRMTLAVAPVGIASTTESLHV